MSARPAEVRTAAARPPRTRAMTVSDLQQVATIEAASYAYPWTHGNFVDAIAAGYLAWVLEDVEQGLIGHLVAMSGFEELHLLNLTIAPAHQRRGHGSRMLQQLIAAAVEMRIASLWLEVRPSNRAGLALYRRYDFRRRGRRKDYYPAAGGLREDAILMVLDLSTRIPKTPHALD